MSRLLSRALAALVALASCAGPAARTPPPAGPGPRARVPEAPPGAHSPSAASVSGGRSLPPDHLSAVDRCSVCHAELFAQWSGSAHRFSSLDNPFYLPAFRAVAAARGAPSTRWCGGCHDPALLFGGDLDGRPIDRAHERARQGVGCLLCHSIERIHDRTGNGNYVVSPEPVPFPARENPPQDEVRRHRERLSRPLLAQGDFCGACHKVGIPEAVSQHHWQRGQNDFDAWDQSAYAGNDLERHDPDAPRRTCQDCHMPLVPAPRGDAAATDGMVRSHRFAGGHTALAAWTADPEAALAARQALEGAVRLDLFSAPTDPSRPSGPLETVPWEPGPRRTFDVVLVNERVGHRFPGGTADVADTWLEVTVTDARGALVAQSGALQPQDPGAPSDEAHRLEVRPIDADGRPALLRDPHRYRAVAYDTTLPPRASRVVRYAWEAPEALALPVTVRVRLLHRRLANPYWAYACAQAPGEQGRPCPPPVVTVVASWQAVAGGGEAPREVPPWRRYYDHGRALGEASLQERVGEALPSLVEAARLAPDRAEPRVELARVALRQGRTADLERYLSEARTLAPGSPVVPFLRALSAADTWRWAGVLEPARSAHRLRPGNVRVLEYLANGLGLAGRHREALELVQRGLGMDPERAQLQHLQALELTALGAPSEALRARAAWERHRVFDDVPGLRARCKRQDPGCARESLPVHVHALTATISPSGVVSGAGGPHNPAPEVRDGHLGVVGQ